jgi:ribosomal protein S18 acetylase RimI-like enzyme
MSIAIQKLSAGNIEIFSDLIRVFEAVFERENFHMPEAAYLQRLLDRDDLLVFVAMDGPTVVGGLTAYVLQQYYATRPLVYVYDLAVKTAYQRQGIGNRLMTSLNDYCRATGVEEVFVQAEEADAHAIDFYRSTGAVPQKVVHFSYPLNNTDA